jgi:hypothetical protein
MGRILSSERTVKSEAISLLLRASLDGWLPGAESTLYLTSFIRGIIDVFGRDLDKACGETVTIGECFLACFSPHNHS